jgi:ribonuclease Y
MIAVTVSALAGLALGAGGAHLRRQQQRRRALAAIEERRVARLTSVTERGADAITTARTEASSLRAGLLAELAEAEAALVDDEKRVTARTEAAQRRIERLNAQIAELDAQFETLETTRIGLDRRRDELRATDRAVRQATEAAAGQTRQQIIDGLKEAVCAEAAVSAAKAARVLEDDALERRELFATRIMEVACQRYGTPLPADRLIATVELPKPGKVRDRLLADGRGVLQIITEATGVEFDPSGEDSFLLRAADPFVREIGRVTYERFVQAGNITEAAARTQAAKAEKDLNKVVRDAGNRAARILELKPVHPDILFLVGKLLYRTSYTQNQWTHAIETAHLCGMMAQDLGLPVELARRSALMHDIGKVLWSETEAVGSHAVSGAAFARDHGEIPEIVHPIAAHHNDEKPSTALAHLVAASDALSGARPGARRETIEAYKQRVEDLERISASFPEIRKSYVIQGGRELQVIVDPQQIDDLGAMRLSEDIAGRIEDECTYPGQIKVTVVREVRRTAVAR